MLPHNAYPTLEKYTKANLATEGDLSEHNGEPYPKFDQENAKMALVFLAQASDFLYTRLGYTIMQTQIHLNRIQRAIELSLRGRQTAPPNPWVGCLLTKDDLIIGEGFHATAGGAHAEVEALAQAGDNVRGSTLYITLEPCAHQGRTPPCATALIHAGITRAFIALPDPDPRVAGKGIEALKQAGIEVTVGIGAAEVERSLRPYLHQRSRGTAFVVGKCSMSLDGKIAAHDLTSQWISSPEALADAQILRAESQAILVGARTALADNPRLTVRIAPLKPLRVLLDLKGSVPPVGPLFDLSLGPLWIVTTTKAPSGVIEQWEKEGIRVVVLPDCDGKADLSHLLRLLAQNGILQLLIEGGGYTLGAFLAQNLIDHFVLYVSPTIIGNQGISAFNGLPMTTLKEAKQLHWEAQRQLGNTWRFDLTPHRE